MSRQLPPTITADYTPDWLPAGWIVQSTVLKRGRETRTYTQLRTGKKFFTKDHVLEYINMEKIQEKRESLVERKKANLKAFKDRRNISERPSLLPNDWEAETRIGSVSGNQFNMYVNTSKEDAFLYENNTLEKSEASSSEEEEIECNQISYAIEEDEEDFSECEYVAEREDVEILSTSLRSQPERIQKLESRAKTQCLFEIEDLSSDSDNNKFPEVETSKEENVVVEVTRTRNIEIIDIESDMMHISASSKVVEVTQDKSEEPLEAQAVQEETANDTRTSVLFPFREAPSHVFDNSNDLSNTIELGLNRQEKNISGTKKRKKKDIEAPTKKLDDWPEPCPNFPFEPLTSSSRIEDDSVIRRYLEEHFSAAVNDDSNLPLPDFGLSSFSNIKITPESKRKKSPGPPCVQVASSSLPSCSYMGTTSMLKQTVAGN